MDFCRDHSPDEQWTLGTNNIALSSCFIALKQPRWPLSKKNQPTPAVRHVNEGLELIRESFADMGWGQTSTKAMN